MGDSLSYLDNILVLSITAIKIRRQFYEQKQYPKQVFNAKSCHVTQEL